MKLTNYKEEYLPEILAFNQSVFPHRKNIEKSFEERFVLNPFSNRGLHQSSFVIDDENKIHGQFLLLPTQFHYQAKTYSGNFGFDFILNDNLRGKGMGKQLSQEAMKYPNYCVVGVSKPSEALHYKFGNKELATAERFIRFRTILSPLNLIFKKKNFDRNKVQYPPEISFKNFNAKKIESPELIINRPFWIKNRLEWDRSIDFLKWRFFSDNKKYAFYQSAENDFYFVVRKVRWKNLNALLLVDFRYLETVNFANIYKMTLKISQLLSCSAVITVTSLEAEKEFLKKNFNKKFGNAIQIMTTNKEVFEANKVAVTFADSDVDNFYGDGTW